MFTYLKFLVCLQDHILLRTWLWVQIPALPSPRNVPGAQVFKLSEPHFPAYQRAGKGREEEGGKKGKAGEIYLT